MNIVSHNPATGAPLKHYPSHSGDECEKVLSQCQEAWTAWKKTSIETRKNTLLSLAQKLKEKEVESASLMADEMGKPITQGLQEIKKCAWVCEYYAQHGEGFLKNIPVEIGTAETSITFQPLGIILAIMPWNFPFWQVFRAAAPAIMAGNTIILKHAPNVPGCALAIEQIVKETSPIPNLLRTLLVDIPETEALIKDKRIQGITMTGSTQAGRQVASLTGRMLKKTVLELGGSDPYIILEDANLDQAAEACATSRMINNGQSCIAAKRFIVVEKVYEAFEQKLKNNLTRYTPGDPLLEATNLGPLARADLRDRLHNQVTRSIELGARCSLGGTLPPGPGNFYPATILTDVTSPMPAYSEELFGPVSVIIKAKDEQHAIELANDTSFGLGGAIFTRDIERGKRIATEEIETGSCAINTFIQSDPRLSFGGIKDSGFGCELGQFGILEFINIKPVIVK